MKSEIEVRKLPDGRLQARRLDGRPLTQEDREHARRKASLETVSPDPTEGRIVAVLIASEVLGADIWFVMMIPSMLMMA